MYSPYGFHSMTKRYRQEALRDARTRHLEGWLRENRKTCAGRSRLSFVLAEMLAVFGAATPAATGKARTW